ncbi:NAD(P)H-hydrate dehydratase [Catenuloplanes sp. NPDC051500]|uniref:NAD(P)H-hydrate dehydratase n=1 Tax=Catenuloplanes sp. NPDC051500 TaxID=3363959 RepID=UPI003791513D
MRGVWRVADVRAAEETLLRELPDGTLMQRAAAGLARRCALLLDRVYGAPVLLLVGAGNNGGDALYAGALLARRGARVTALLLSPDRAHREGLADLRRSGGRVRTAWSETIDAELVVDGIVGIGATGGLREPAVSIVEALRARTPRPIMVAVDVPSGVDVDTGAVEGAAVRADVTVTFGCLKPAHVAGPAAPLAGQVDLVDIGISLPAAPALRVPDAADLAGWWPRLHAGSEKYNRGVVGIATGSHTYPGAAVLSTAGALAGPTGMVRYAGTARAEVLQRHPSVVAADSVADAGRVQAWLCGSGIGTDADARAALSAVLATDLPVVLDADALGMLVDGSSADRLRDRAAPLVLTPHDREFARLAGEPGPDRAAAAHRLATSMNAVVLLKGDRTIVAAPDGETWVNPTGSPALSTGGTGDVLAGLLASLLAAGLPAVRAAVTAAYLHGLAGRIAAERGPVTAPDVAAALPEAVATITN